MPIRTISINRAPALTLWAAVVAQRFGFDEDEALTLGMAVAGLNAQAKGRRLGIFKPHEDKAKQAREKERGERYWIEALGPYVVDTAEGPREVADLFFGDGTATRQVPFAWFTFVDSDGA
jgi:hypothetical protein